MKVLLIVDAQHDFIDGCLGTPEAQAALPYISDKITKALEDGTAIIFTRDTHFKDSYMTSNEGKHLPVEHCIYQTQGWNVHEDVDVIGAYHINKPRFGKTDIGLDIYDYVKQIDETEEVEEIEICGFCTDICVVSNALIIKGTKELEDVNVIVDAKACAGVTPETHEAALKVMEMCQIEVRRD